MFAQVTELPPRSDDEPPAKDWPILLVIGILTVLDVLALTQLFFGWPL